MVGMLNGEGADGLEARLQAFRQSDAERDALVKELVDELFRLQRAYDDKCNDLDSEITSRRHWQGQSQDVKRDLNLVRQQLDSNPFALALIDGDGAIFQDHLVKAGADGASEAGHNLLNDIKKHIQECYEKSSGSSGQWSIMVQIFCNFDGLSRKLAQVGILKSPGEFNIFARALSLSQPLFSFVDVGSGKERADHKIREMFRLFVSNMHCKHIIFGGCHDNGYLPTLEQYRRDDRVSSRLSLLESTPAERSYTLLGFPIARFPSVFRTEHLPEFKVLAPSATSFVPQPTVQTNSYSQDSPLATPAMHAPPAKVAAPAPTSTFSPTPQQASAGAPTNGVSPARPTSVVSTVSSTYATVGALETPLGAISIAPTKPTTTLKSILLNAYDERIDQKLPKADGQSIINLNRRIKERKVCNNFHLLGRCTNGQYCQYAHGERLGPKEQLALRQKARDRLCPTRSECRDFDCFFGHQCPREGCDWEGCYFEDLHDLDQTVAMKMYEDGQITVVNERVHR